MSKRRIYELARELNMTNRVLIDKIQKMGYKEIQKHTQSIDDDLASRIKAALCEKKPEAGVVEETRVKTGVIRRRRKPSVVKEPKPAPKVEAKAETPEKPSPHKTAEKVEPEKEPENKAETDQKTTLELVTETSEEKPEDENESKAVEPIEKEIEKEKTEETGAPESEPVSRTDIHETKENNTLEKADKADVSFVQKKPAEEKAEKSAPRPKKRKKSGSTAKIIRLPEKPVEPVQRKKPEKPDLTGPDRSSEIVPGVSAPVKEIPASDRKKKKKKKGVVPEKEQKLKKSQRKKGFRRKEIVEGSALLDRKSRKRKGRKKSKAEARAHEQTPQITTPKAIKRRVKIDDTIVLADFAKRLGIKSSELIAKLMGMGMMVTVNQTIDFDTAVLLAAEFNFEVERASFEEETIIGAAEDRPEQLVPRPPVVTIMGHVDHGKTSLLDVIRHSKVTEAEAGGITQHIGAYHIGMERGDIIFLDTPGHEAFTAMRARGAQVTDIVVLVVAADDGVMPQTIEAINHSKTAGVPIIVAVNKIDKPEADTERVKRELAEYDIIPEEWGGNNIFVNVSAKTKQGIDELLEMILLQAEVLELKANPDKRARGYIIESRMDIGRGPVATVLITEGTLHTGDAVVSGLYHGKIRAMFDDRGRPVSDATPSIPVEIIGLSGVPMAGDELVAVADEKDARQVSEHRMRKQRSRELAKTSRLSLEKLYEQMQEGMVKDLNLIIKADVQGSIEALRDSLIKLSTDEVKIHIIHAATGTINESDISLAAVSNAIIIGFNVRPSSRVAQMAEEENVDIRYYNVIYNAINEIKDAMVGMMESKYEEEVIGRAEVRQVFMVPNIGAVAGAYVMDGKIERGQPIRLLRDGIIVFEGKISSLKRFKDDVKEVTQNYECGIGIENFNDIKVNDVIECYRLVEVKPVYE